MSKHVLLVEDDHDLAIELEEAAAQVGIKLVRVSNAGDAIRILEQRADIRVVATDIMLGDISGLELLRKLATLGPDKRVRAVVLSGYSTVDHVLIALRLGVVDFLPKPIMPGEFVNALQRALLSVPTTHSTPRLLRSDAAELLLRARQKRDAIFGAELFEDPAWNIMLDLYTSTLNGKTVTVSDLCVASGTSPTTALRRIGVLATMGLINRVPDATDRRRVLVTPTQEGLDAMNRFSEWFRDEVVHDKPSSRPVQNDANS